MSPVRVGLRCDAGATRGVGHLVRCVALAEELATRGVQPVFLGDPGGLPWAAEQLARRGFPRHPGPDTPDAMLAAVKEHGLAAAVLDSYTLDPGCAGALREQRVPVLAVVDGDLRGQDADLYLDQNLDAELSAPPLPADAVRLAGLRYVLLRDDVTRLRPAHPPRRPASARPRVLAFFGGTDAFSAAPPLCRLVLGTGLPVELTVVAGTPALHRELLMLHGLPEQELRVITPTDRLPALVAESDLVVSASGTSTWELLCLGAAAAMVWVVDNQRLGYDRVVARGLAAGLGHLPDLTDPDGTHALAARDTLRRLMSSPNARAAASARALGAVDGLGRARVADELLALVASRRDH
ncbi:spore coat protein [Catellatospora sp. NPDC049609]|uniref:PseG/SpsG family protein n=1 Tax=Catellatospora sp. NPDC049609 TaxID=3155505 RepID=UPI0034447E40